MSETLSDILQQTSDPTPVVDTTPTDSSVTEPAGATQTQNEYEVPDDVRTYLEQNPDHKPIADTLNKHFQRAFTGRLQEAAELRKLVEGVDPNSISTLRQLQQLAQTNPDAVAQWYRSQADAIHPNSQPTHQPSPASVGQDDDPFRDIETVTDAEAILLQHARDSYNWRKQVEREQVSQKEKQEYDKLVQKGTQVKSERNALQQEFGVQIPDVELAQIWDKAERAELTIRQAYLALNSERILPSLLQRARDEASGIVQNKLNSSAGNPGVTASRNNTSANTKGTLQDYFAEALK